MSISSYSRGASLSSAVRSMSMILKPTAASMRPILLSSLLDKETKVQRGQVLAQGSCKQMSELAINPGLAPFTTAWVCRIVFLGSRGDRVIGQ